MINKLRERVEAATTKTVNTALDIVGDKVAPELREERMSICLSCEKLYKPTTTCKMCGCFMSLKTWLPRQSCPANKWGPDPSLADKN